MANDYAAIQARIADELARTDLTAQIKAEILSAIRHYARQRFWFNEEAATATTTPGAAGLKIAVPSDAVEFDEMTVAVGGIPQPMERLPWRDFVARGALNTAAHGVPARWAYRDDQFWLSPTPDAAYTLTLYYVNTLPELAADGDSNAWTTIAEELIRARACAAVRIRYLRDSAAMAEQQAFAALGDGYLNAFEKMAYTALRAQTTRRRAPRRLHTDIGTGGTYNIVTDG